MTRSDISTVRKMITWIGPFGVFLSHVIAFCVLYLVLTIFVPSLKLHYEIDNVAITPVFARINVISEHVIYYSLISILVIFADAVIIALISRSASRWLSAYSHTMHSCLVLLLLVTFASMMHPLFWDDARKAKIESRSGIIPSVGVQRQSTNNELQPSARSAALTCVQSSARTG